jgi:hypothetical protein
VSTPTAAVASLRLTTKILPYRILTITAFRFDIRDTHCRNEIEVLLLWYLSRRALLRITAVVLLRQQRYDINETLRRTTRNSKSPYRILTITAFRIDIRGTATGVLGLIDRIPRSRSNDRNSKLLSLQQTPILFIDYLQVLASRNH